MISQGNLNMKKIFLGLNNVTSVYKGTEKIWPIEQDYLTFEVIDEGTWFRFSNNSQYSLDGGSTWVTLAANVTSPAFSAGSKIMWKARLTPSGSNGIGRFASERRFNVEGNIMSLLFGDDFEGKTDLTGYNYAFCGLFSYCDRLVSAKNLKLPATILANNCYDQMFRNCLYLTEAPSILPATTLTNNCYNQMFLSCTSLRTPPELPATTLATSCYFGMFWGCENMTKAPDLPATTLAPYCYQYLFNYCYRVIYVKCLATDISAYNCTEAWFGAVNSIGTFVKDASMTGWTRGMSGIPNNWTVQNA